MKRSRRILFSAAMGVGVFGMSKGIESTATTYEQINKPVVACAGVLGEVATTSATVPKECVRGEFKRVEHITRTYTPQKGSSDKSVSIRYSLPSSDEYLKDNFMSKDVFDESRRQLQRVFIGISALGGLLMYPLSANMFRKPDQDEAEAVSTSEDTAS